MDMKQLEAFVQVVKTRSFSKAAESLFFTQPTISSHISSLERELGGPLIVRTPKAAIPTERGALLYEHALQILTLRDNAIALCRDRKTDEIAGIIKIAVSTVPHQYVLPRIMFRFREQYPGVSFEVTGTDSKGVQSKIVSGDTEIGLTGSSWKTDVCVFEPFLNDYMVVATPNIGEYKKLTALKSEDLKRYPMLVREPGSGTRKETEEYLKSKGMSYKDLNIAAQLDNPGIIKNAVVQGMGIAILPMFLVSDIARQGLLRIFHLDGQLIARKLYFVYHKNHFLSLAASVFRDFVLEEAADLFPEEVRLGFST